MTFGSVHDYSEIDAERFNRFFSELSTVMKEQRAKLASARAEIQATAQQVVDAAIDGFEKALQFIERLALIPRWEQFVAGKTETFQRALERNRTPYSKHRDMLIKRLSFYEQKQTRINGWPIMDPTNRAGRTRSPRFRRIPVGGEPDPED